MLTPPGWALWLALIGGFSGGWAANGWRLEAQYADAASKVAKEAKDALTAAMTERDELAKKLTETNDAALAELQGAQNETNRLRDCLRAGTCGLRVAAKCPEGSGTPGASVDINAGAELAESARQSYFALRDGIDRASAQLSACQSELKWRVE